MSTATEFESPTLTPTLRVYIGHCLHSHLGKWHDLTYLEDDEVTALFSTLREGYVILDKEGILAGCVDQYSRADEINRALSLGVEYGEHTVAVVQAALGSSMDDVAEVLERGVHTGTVKAYLEENYWDAAVTALESAGVSSSVLEFDGWAHDLVCGGEVCVVETESGCYFWFNR